MTRILVTNDDGIHSDGLIVLARALERLGEVTVVAPAHEMSAASHSLTLTRPLRVDRIDSRHFSVDGTPTDCVTIAIGHLMKDRRPDIVLSGINRGPNLGDDTTYSGTVAGALEGTIHGLPGIAVSLVTRSNFDYTHAAEFAATLAEKVLADGLPKGTLLSVNVPVGPVRGVRITRQGVKTAKPSVIVGVDPRQRHYYWIGEDYSTPIHDDGTDYAAVADGLVSVTPLRNDLTDYRALDELRGKGWIPSHEARTRGAR
ncbi:MAG: 5'/3'-nucleotidase SurE [Acidobacteria bacterium]|nr:5'/3'-nucleotidase SurE [Acidobacteriota bacterium]